jgi:hypothetical protein
MQVHISLIMIKLVDCKLPWLLPKLRCGFARRSILGRQNYCQCVFTGKAWTTYVDYIGDMLVVRNLVCLALLD